MARTRSSPHQKTKHHRCPRRWKGTTCPENLITLPRWEHDAWHCLVNHQYPISIATQLTLWRLYPNTSFVAKRTGELYADIAGVALLFDSIQPKMTPVHTRTWHALQRVWHKRGVDIKDPCAVAGYISRRYLHPDYTLIVVHGDTTARAATL